MQKTTLCGVERSVLLTQFFRVIKSGVEHVARMGRGEAYIGFWWGNLKERNHLDDPVVDDRILRSIFRKSDVGGGPRTGSSWHRIRTGGGHLSE